MSKWWVSPNLNISGIISPDSKKDKINLYYQTNIGYNSNFQIIPKLTTSFNIGMHRIRYLDDDNYRFYHTTLFSTLEGQLQYLSIAWIYLFNDWHRQIIQVDYSKTIFDNIQLVPGIKFLLSNSVFQTEPVIRLQIEL